MQKRLLILIAAMVSLFGCSQSSSINGIQVDKNLFHTYRCESDNSFEVAYIPDSDIAVLRIAEGEENDANDYSLIRVRAGSGTRYILNDGTAEVKNPVTLRTKGDEARLELNQHVYKNCKTQ